MKTDKRRLDRRWADGITKLDLGFLFAFGIMAGAGLAVLYSFLKGA